MKTSAEKQVRNRATKSRIAVMRKKLDETIASGDAASIKAAFSAYCSGLDKAVKHGAVEANTASRGKARAAARAAAKRAA